MNRAIEEIYSALNGRQYNLSTETAVQIGIQASLQAHIATKCAIDFDYFSKWIIYREKVLSKKSRIDFMIEPFGIGIEVKIKGSPLKTLAQCERYCEHDEVKALILATSKFMGFPSEINGKPIYLIHLSKALL